MKKFAKWLAVLPLVLIMAVGLVACGPNTPDPTGPTTPEAFTSFFEELLSETAPKTNWTLEQTMTITVGNATATEKFVIKRDGFKWYMLNEETVREGNNPAETEKDEYFQSFENGSIFSYGFDSEDNKWLKWIESTGDTAQDDWNEDANYFLHVFAEQFDTEDFELVSGVWRLKAGKTMNFGLGKTNNVTLTFGANGSLVMTARIFITSEAELVSMIEEELEEFYRYIEYLADTYDLDFDEFMLEMALDAGFDSVQEFIDAFIEEIMEDLLEELEDFEDMTIIVNAALKDVGTTVINLPNATLVD
ncbi:MAG: hypothetical protein FWH03_04170 [Firmicutes bacterium]|nr:hypothetical protein [Bacillota bacterium]